MTNPIEHCLSCPDVGSRELGYYRVSLVLVLVRAYSGVFSHTVEPEVCKVRFRLQVCFGGVSVR